MNLLSLPLHFVLLSVAVVICYILIHLRLARLDVHLRDLEGLNGIDDRLASIDEQLSGLEQTADKATQVRMWERLKRLNRELVDLREVTEQIRNQTNGLPEMRVIHEKYTKLPRALDPSQPAASQVIKLIELRLAELGYSKVDITGDLSNAGLSDEIQVNVRATHSGEPCIGYVVMRGSEMEELEMRRVAMTRD